MSDRMRVTIEGQDNASDEMRRVGQSATQMGRAVDTASDQMERGFRGVNQALDAVERNTAETVRAINRLADAEEKAARSTDDLERKTSSFSKTGAALGAVVGSVTGLLSDFARAAAEEEAIFTRLEAAVDATGVAYDDLAPAIDAAVASAEELSFADDQAATALTNLTTITGSAQEAMNLMGLAMDVARGRGISLADAATLVGRAAEGQTAALSRMGIVLQEGATAQDALNALQQRYAGQSEAYADTTQGAIDRLKNSFDNWSESIGASTGELQTVLTLLPGLSTAFSGIATLAGAAAPRVISLVTSVGGLAAVLGPIGLVAAGLAAAGAVAYLVTRHEEQEAVVVDVDEAVDGLIDTLNQLAATVGTSAPQFVALDAWTAQLAEIIALQNEAAAATEAVGEAARIAAEAAFIEENPLEENINQETEAILAGLEARDAAIAKYLERLDQFGLDAEEAARAEQMLAQATSYTGEAFEEVAQHVEEANHDFAMGRIDADAYLARLEAIPAIALAATEAQGELVEAQRAARESLGDLTDAWESLGETLDEHTERQRAMDAAISAGTARVTAGVDAVTAAREQGRAAQQEARDAARAEAEAAVAAAEAHDQLAAAARASSDAFRGGLPGLQAAVDAMDSLHYASFAASDGLVTLAEQERYLVGLGNDLATQQADLATELGFYQGAVGDMTAAYDILVARWQAGEQLSQDQLDFLAEYDAEAPGHARAIEDLVIQQGLLADAQLDNAAAQEGLTATMGETNEVIGDLAETIGDFVDAYREAMGLEPLDNLTPSEQTFAAWERLAGYVAAAAGAGSPAPTGPVLPGGGGGAVAAPPVPRDAGATAIAVTLDTTAVKLGADEIAGYLAAVTEADWSVQLVGDGDDAFAVIRDVEGNVQAVVKGEYIVVIDGDNLGATAEIDATWAALDAIDGASATVSVDAATAGARFAINALTGYQGDAYVNVYARPVGGMVGPTELGLAEGGLVNGLPPAANGRLIRAGEVGPEWVSTPGGGGFLAARDGVYVAPVDSYVHTAPQTRAMAQQSSRLSRPIVIQQMTVVANNPQQFMAQMTAIGR